MKKIIALCLSMVFVLLCLSACGVNQAESEMNDDTNSAGNEAGDIIFPIPERGIIFTIPQEYLDKGIVVEGFNENIKGYKMASISYYSPTSNRLLDEIIDMDPAERTMEVEAEYTQKIWDTSRCLMEVVIVPENEYEDAMNAGVSNDDFTYYSPAELYTKINGYAFIIAIPQLDDGALTAEEAEAYHACRDYMETVKSNIEFVPVELENDETVVGDCIPAFRTSDIYGNEVTEDIFLEKELTVVNIWGTFCGPCIEEMPELEMLAQKYGEHVQFVGIVGDIEGAEDHEHLELAKLIVERAGVSFTNLIVNEDMESLMSGIIGFPTTVFVDRFGNIIGEPIVGSDISCTEETIITIMN